MGIFESPREREAPGMYKGQLQSYDDLMNEISGMQSGFSGVNSIYDIMNKFGMKKRTAADVSSTFNPARRNLATRQGQANQSVAARMRGSNATPEVSFGNVTSQFAPAYGELESNAAQTGLNVERSDESNIASMLADILGKKDQYGFTKTGLKANVLGNKGNSISDYLSSLSGASTFDDIMSLLGVGAKGYSAVAGAGGGGGKG